MEIKLEQLPKLISKYSENIYYPLTGLLVTVFPVVTLWPSAIASENKCVPMIYLWIALFLFALFSGGCLIAFAIKWFDREIHKQINTCKKKKKIQQYYTKLFSRQIWGVVCQLMNNKNAPVKLSKSLYEEFDRKNLFGEDRLSQNNHCCVFDRHKRSDDISNEKTEKELHAQELGFSLPFSGSRYVSLTDLSFHKIRKNCFHKKGKKWILNKNMLREDE